MDFDKLLDYLKTIDLTKIKDETLVLSDDAENALLQLCEAEKFVEEAKEKLKARFLEIAQKNPKLKKYEGSRVSVGYRMTRRKAITGDPDPKFYTIKKEPNTKAIDSYMEATGELPKGIEEKTFEFITFKIN